MSAVREGYLTGKVAVITGGCGGIGTAICTRFAAEGATVYATDIVEPAVDADAVAGVAFHRHDVTSERSAVELMGRIGRDHGRLHVLVNAAGIEIEKTVERTSLEEWNRIFAINVTGTLQSSTANGTSPRRAVLAVAGNSTASAAMAMPGFMVSAWHVSWKEAGTARYFRPARYRAMHRWYGAEIDRDANR